MSPLPALAAVSILVIVIPALLVLGSFLRSQDASSKSLKATDLQCAHWSTQRLCQISGVPVSDGRLLELLPPAAEGHSLEAISVALRSLGLVCEGYRESWADLVENGPPAIAHLSHPNHFVVVCGIDSDLRAVHVYDGDGARTRVRREDFEKRWTGAVLRVVDHAQGMTEQNVRFERLLVDKGDIAATGAVEVFEFPFTNVSSEPLRIDSVTPSCSCVGVDKPDGSLGPGEASVIRLKYKVAPAAGPFMQSALVTTSGGSHCRLMISASGYSGASFSVIPASIEGAKLIRGRDNSFSLFLHNAGRWTDTRVRGVTGTISNAVITGYKVHSETRDERNRYSGGIGVANETQRLEVFVRPSDGPAVTALGRLAIETNVPRHETIAVGFSAAVLPRIRVLPETMVFHQDPTGTLSQVINLVFDESQRCGFYSLDSIRVGDLALNTSQYAVTETSYGLKIEVSLPLAMLATAASDSLVIQLRSTGTDVIECVPVRLYAARITPAPSSAR